MIIVRANLLSTDHVPGRVLGAILTIFSHPSNESGTTMKPILQMGNLPNVCDRLGTTSSKGEADSGWRRVSEQELQNLLQREELCGAPCAAGPFGYPGFTCRYFLRQLRLVLHTSLPGQSEASSYPFPRDRL